MKAVIGCPKGKYNAGKCIVGTEVQTIIFPKDGWTADKARAWLRDHDFKSGLDITDDSFRARQKDPGSFDPDSLRTVTLTGGGESLQHFRLTEHNRRIPFKTRILAAVPGRSLNGRIYTKELLQQSSPLYEGKTFILDHVIDDVEKVVGVFSRPRYATERGMDGNAYEGLWLDGVGSMDENLFELVKGTGLVPPLVRGFSIGGTGDGEVVASGDVLIKRFVPMEGSLTAFAGIPAAHLATIDQIREHYLKGQSQEVKKTSIPVKERMVSLEEAEKQAAEVKEGPIPDQDTGAGTRQRNDVRPRLPTPGRGKQVTHLQPQATTSADTGFTQEPEQHSTGSAPMPAEGSKGPSNEIGPPGTSPDAMKLTPTIVARPEPSRDAPITGNKSATPQLSGKVHGPGEPRDIPGVDAPMDIPDTKPKSQGPQSEMQEPDDPEDEEDEDEEERMRSKSTTVSTTTSRTDSELVIEPDDEESHQFTLAQAHVKEDDEPTGVTKDTQPMAHPGEEKPVSVENPILKVASQPLTKQQEFAPPDSVPIQERAFAMAPDAGVLKTLQHLVKPKHSTEEQIIGLLRAWNYGKQPKEASFKRLQVQRGPTPTAKVNDSSIASIARPAPVTKESVQTKTLTNMAPTWSASSITTLSSRAVEVMEQVKRNPVLPNKASETFRRLVPEILELR